MRAGQQQRQKMRAAPKSEKMTAAAIFPGERLSSTRGGANVRMGCDTERRTSDKGRMTTGTPSVTIADDRFLAASKTPFVTDAAMRGSSLAYAKASKMRDRRDETYAGRKPAVARSVAPGATERFWGMQITSCTNTGPALGCTFKVALPLTLSTADAQALFELRYASVDGSAGPPSDFASAAAPVVDENASPLHDAGKELHDTAGGGTSEGTPIALTSTRSPRKPIADEKAARKLTDSAGHRGEPAGSTLSAPKSTSLSTPIKSAGAPAAAAAAAAATGKSGAGEKEPEVVADALVDWVSV